MYIARTQEGPLIMIPVSHFFQAYENVKHVVTRTPFALAPFLTEISHAEIYLKKENLQLTGAYKLRGAYNKISSLSAEERARGVVASSAGNHAQGVAYSAKEFGISATIVMPESTPLLKVNGVQSLSADVILHGDSYDDAYNKAMELSESRGMTFIHPFADDKVIAGQGTVALEMIEEQSNLDTVVVPIGGGGLISGVAAVYKQLHPNVRIVGVTAKGAPAMYQSFCNKKPFNSESVRTIADGIAVRDTSEKTLTYILECVDEIIQITDDEIANAVLYLVEKQKLVVEGAGSVGVAAILHDKVPEIKGSKVGVILSGGNLDVTMLSVIIEKGLIKSGRKMNLVVTLIDKPGSLMHIANIFHSIRANIVHIGYDRTSTSLKFGDANVTIALETKGPDHQDKIREELRKNGYKFSESF